MGGGIAHVAALAGFDVHLYDIAAPALARARAAIEKNLARHVRKERIAPDAATEALSRVHITSELAPLSEVQLAIEAATEDRDLKVRIFSALCPVLAPGALLCSNTSSISITDLARHTDRPERFMGMHFMNPVPVMELVELIRGLATDDTTCATIEAVAAKMGKTTVMSTKGFCGKR